MTYLKTIKIVIKKTGFRDILYLLSCGIGAGAIFCSIKDVDINSMAYLSIKVFGVLLFLLSLVLIDSSLHIQKRKLRKSYGEIKELLGESSKFALNIEKVSFWFFVIFTSLGFSFVLRNSGVVGIVSSSLSVAFFSFILSRIYIAESVIMDGTNRNK